MRQGRTHGWLIVPVGLLLLGPIVYLLVRALQGARLISVHATRRAVSATTHDPRAWLILASAAALIALIGWALTERSRAALARASGESEESAREAMRRRDQAEEQLRQVEEDREREREQHRRYERAWHAQRDWNRHLREKILDLQHREGALGHLDVREMILRLTMGLVEAEKAVLLSREHEPDGDLKVVCAVGFEHDPSQSALAQRFGQEVIDQGTTVREDDQRDMDAQKRGPADEEVQNLLAIPIYLRDEFSGAIICANREGGFEDFDDEVLVSVGDHAGAVLQNSRLHGELRSAYLMTVRVLASVIEVKDPDLRGHSDAVAEYVLAVADKLGFEPRRREELVFGSLLHDVGKLGISERILLKPGPLSDEERTVMQLHPRIGYHLIRQIPALEPIAPAVLHHHERYDGDGYPGRLRGETIPLEARIIAVADAFSAMTVERPYSHARTVDEACAELERCAGEQFDPEVVQLFVSEVRRRPPDQLVGDPAPPDPELEVHRQPGQFVLGGDSFGITDSLTLLYSHRHFHETTRAETSRANLQQRPFGVIVARLTDLDAVNSESGYAAGDAAIQQVAEAFRRAAGRCNGLAFRVSGRRIGLVVPGHDESAIRRVADSLREELREGPALSMGAAAWESGASAEQIIERATRADEQLSDLQGARP